MAKKLLVGDLHLKRDNIESSGALLQRIVDLSRDVEETIIMGDMYNDHGVIPASVQRVVTDFLDKLPEFKTKCLEGNHDVANDQVSSSLYVHSSQVEIVPKPQQTKRFAYLPFYRNPDDFIAAVKCLELPGTGLLNVFCHQEFNGAQFETGFYAPHGVDPNQFDPRIRFISGHIHNGQEFGNVWYVGAPRWLTKGDANQTRGLWIVEFHDVTGGIINKEFISSDDICPVYRSFIVTDSDISSGNLPSAKGTDRVFIEYIGSDSQAVKLLQSKYRNLSLKHRKVTTPVQQVVGESKGVKASVVDYVTSLDIKGDRDIVLKEIFKRLSW